MDAEGWRLEIPEELGGIAAPPSLRWAVAELILGSNPAAFMYMAGPGFAAILWHLGNEDQKKLAELMIERQWGATMVLTEPDAGSDVGAGTTKAFPNEDGSWRIEGVKRFITSAEHDMSENIVHLVLARPQGVEGVGGPGTKGLSLFVVPKFHVDLETGELGERNGAYVTNVEKKMGLKVSTTCELTFGDGKDGHRLAGRRRPRRHRADVQGHRVRPHDGGHQGHRDAVHRLPQRAGLRQEARPGRRPHQMMDKTAPRVTISHHPDVRRLLMLQKSYAEGMRALVAYTSSWQDKVEAAELGDSVETSTWRSG